MSTDESLKIKTKHLKGCLGGKPEGERNMIKYVIAHINTIDVENGTANVDVMYKEDDILLWGRYDKLDKDLVLFATRKEADQYIDKLFGKDGMYLSYGVKVYGQ